VIDGEWTLIQSGNYSVNSIPLNNEDGGNPINFITGNRDMGIAIKSPQLSNFFADLIKSDIELLALSTTSTEPKFLEEFEAPALVEPAPHQLPLKLFPSKRLEPKESISVRPILTPDNYMEEIPEILSKAQKSIYIENQYIRGQQPEVSKLLEAIKKAKDNNSSLDVRIVLGKIFGKDDVVKEQTNLTHLKSLYGLALDTNIRYIDTTRFVHCHNKLIIIDEKFVLISSQNWSDTGVSTNREAGLYIKYEDLAKYYSLIFESDWLTAQKTIPMPTFDAIGSIELASGKFISVVAADHIEV
jgi:phosphatidylserine/phosphatidylglycerophosphate/cardiolipin synthase-like enzyme